ncbi:uncharacterized protein METZ01_LOCUS216964 [marine metagenome]|uniref:Uncharacterized protein n=1 Tax=marine metagenome TaxID=408172 RepID=A0A382FM61_9ZZZZ
MALQALNEKLLALDIGLAQEAIVSEALKVPSAA